MTDTLPPGVTHADIDKRFGDPRDDVPDEVPSPDRPECDQCGLPLPWRAARRDEPTLCEAHRDDGGEPCR